MALGTRNKFGAPMFEPEFFRKLMYCIEENTCDIVGTFRCPPQSFGAQGMVPPTAPLVTALTWMDKYWENVVKFHYFAARCSPFGIKPALWTRLQSPPSYFHYLIIDAILCRPRSRAATEIAEVAKHYRLFPSGHAAEVDKRTTTREQFINKTKSQFLPRLAAARWKSGLRRK